MKAVVIKLGLLAVASFALSFQSFAQDEKKETIIHILKLSNDLTIHSHDIQYSDQGEPFVPYQFLKPATEGLLPDKPYCNLWIKKEIAAQVQVSKLPIILKSKYVWQIKEKQILYKGLLEESVQYKLDHPRINDLYCKNVSKISMTKDILGVVFTETRARRVFKFLQKTEKPSKPAKSPSPKKG